MLPEKQAIRALAKGHDVTASAKPDKNDEHGGRHGWEKVADPHAEEYYLWWPATLKGGVTFQAETAKREGLI